jgi:outer membrane receptor protein involved in Fe transport
MSPNLYSQYIVSGSVSDPDGNPLVGANISVQESGSVTITDDLGQFQIDLKSTGNFTIIAYYIAHTSVRQKVELSDNQPQVLLDFTLELDPLQISQIVIIDRTQSVSSEALSQKISSVSGKKLQNYGAYGTADLLSNIPGVFSDASAGEVFSRIYTRGISISAEDDLGWFYIGLEEDGLPIAATQHTYFSPDLFHRLDLTTQRLEGVNGGKSSLLGQNAPGALFNFKSKTGGSTHQGSAQMTIGSEGELNPMGRIDVAYSGPISDEWHYMVGGFYRRSTGPRNVEIDWNKGGQIKANVSRNAKNYFLKIYGKYLNDHTNRWYGLPGQNWDDPRAAFGFDFNHNALTIPRVNTTLPDARNGGSYRYNSDNGIWTKEASIGMDYQRIIGDWTFRNNVKYGHKTADWQSFIGNQPLGLESFFPYLLSGISPDFSTIPLGNISFRDAISNQLVAEVNNFGILAGLEGLPPTFEYLSGSLPNDALMGVAPWKKIDSSTEFMNRFSINGKIGNHDPYFIGFYSRSDVETFTSASFAYATYEANPRLLSVSLENPGEEIIRLSDSDGIANYGGLLFNSGSAQVNQWSLTLGDKWQLSDNWILDVGGQYNRNNQKGSKENTAPSDLDNNPLTAYNNSFLTRTGKEGFDLSYDYFSWSVGLLHNLNDRANIYARYTQGNKSPELNYVFNNFQNLPIPGPGRIQRIDQAELGFRTRTIKNALSISAFFSKLSNVAFSEFVFDEESGSLFFTPEQLNATRTLGVNIEAYTSLSKFFRIIGKATIQNPEATEFTVYDAAGTGSIDDDQLYDFSGNRIPHNPQLMFEIQPEVSLAKNKIFARYRFMGAREGNIENAFTLPAFGKIDFGIDFAVNDQILLQLIANNIFNSAGLMNFFGPNEFGSSANAATAQYISANPNGSFVVFPILPRSIYFKIGYNF